METLLDLTDLTLERATEIVKAKFKFGILSGTPIEKMIAYAIDIPAEEVRIKENEIKIINSDGCYHAADLTQMMNLVIKSGDMYFRFDSLAFEATVETRYGQESIRRDEIFTYVVSGTTLVSAD